MTITCRSTGVLSPRLHLSYVIDPHPCSFNLCVSHAEPEGAVPERSTSYQSFNVVAHKRLGKLKKKVLICRQCLAVVLTRLASTHLLLWAVDDHQVGFSSDAVRSAVIPVLFDVAGLSKRK